MRTTVKLGLALVGLALPALSRAQLSIGFRAGYAIPMGDAATVAGFGSFKEADLFRAVVPLQIEAAWRLTPALAAGLYGSYGFAIAGSQLKALVCDASSSCSGLSDLRFGAQATWSFGPQGPVEPWVGLGAGYERARFQGKGATYPSGLPPPAPPAVTGDLTGSLRGWEVNVQGGADFRLGSQLLAGPYLQAGAGQYRVQDVGYVSPVPGNGAIPGPRPHYFLTVGLRGRYDL